MIDFGPLDPTSGTIAVCALLIPLLIWAMGDLLQRIERLHATPTAGPGGGARMQPNKAKRPESRG